MYDKSINITKENQKNRSNLNIKENEARVRKQKDGETLGERIESYLEDLKKKKVSQLIDDAFYEEIHEDGIPFRVRKTNLLRDVKVEKKLADSKAEKGEHLQINKTLDIPDDVLQRNIILEKNAVAEAKRDRTFEEFSQMYEDHILGKIDPQERVGDRPVTAAIEDRVNSQGRMGTGLGNNAAEDDRESGTREKSKSNIETAKSNNRG